MSLFVSSTCAVGTSPAETVVNAVSWCKNDAIAALATFSVDENDRETNQVVLVNNEGELIPNSEITHDVDPMVFEWHPFEKIIAIGWADGMVSSWFVDSKGKPSSQSSNTTQHQNSITVMKWSSNGKRLVTGDKKGTVCVWGADPKGALSILRQYKKKGEIMSLVFCNLVAPMKGAVAVVPAFFYGTDKGSIVYADDVGHCTEVQTLTSSIDALMIYEDCNRLIVLTRSLLLTQYNLTEDGRVSRAMQVKLSVSSDIMDRGLNTRNNLVWAAPGLLAVATEEKMIRFLDLAGDYDSYNITLASALGGFVERSDKVCCVAFSAQARSLAIGTTIGVVAVFKFNGSLTTAAKVGTTVGDWELVFRTLLNAPILSLAWATQGGCIAAVTEDGCVLLNEAVIHAAVAGDLTVVQDGASDLYLHYAGNANNQSGIATGAQKMIATGMGVMRGLAVGRSCLVAWSGKLAKVYRISDPNNSDILRVEAIDPPLKTSSLSMAIADASFIVDEALFMCEGPLVKILNFKGTAKASIHFSEAEGVPILVDLSAKYLAVITQKGTIKFLDVHTPSKPKQLGSAGTFPLTLHASTGMQNKGQLSVRSIKLNPSGTMLAVLCHIITLESFSMPETRLFVYDRTRGHVMQYDFQALKRYPIAVFWDEGDDRLLACETLPLRETPLPPAVGKDGAAASVGGVISGLEGAIAKASGSKSTLPQAGQGQSSRSLKTHQDNNEAGDISPLSAVGDGTATAAAVAAVPASVFPGREVYLLFATSEQGLLLQDSLRSDHTTLGPLMGLAAPRLFYRKLTRPNNANNTHDDEEDGDEESGNKNNNEGNMQDGSIEAITNNANVVFRVLRDFAGLGPLHTITDAIKSALLDFSFYLTLGKLDDAYRVVREINSPSIWENMAMMCVKSRRLDVAEICLGNMGHARGAAAVREAKKEGSVEVAVGVLAIQLGMIDDAMQLFIEANRFDLLNQLQQASGRWQRALTTATTRDRIHLKSTHYHYAKYLESIGRIDDAIEHYTHADTARQEVPRMLFHLGRIDKLGEFVLQSDDKALLKWWAAYMESLGRIDRAKKIYAKAKDHLSLVRIFCFNGDLQQAAEIVTETNDRAAAYHFARQLELANEFQEAINFFALSGCFNHCIRLAKEHGLDAELMRFALRSTPALMVESGMHFEAKGEADKAMQLYHKGGDTPRALELCFRIGEEAESNGSNNNPNNGSRNARDKNQQQHAVMAYEMLNTIAQELLLDSSSANPQLLARCADFLVTHKQFDKAVELYVTAKRYMAAVEMCLNHRVEIADTMAEKLTPPEGSVDTSERREILMDLAKALKKQGSFQLASKKYTLAGDRVRAIKCLVRSGDTNAVISYASKARHPEIYTLAANYLQQMNWRASIDIMKAIITFYTKAKSFIQLAGFYDSCAQAEIDEYGAYDKAAGALNEAIKYLAKDTSKTAADLASAMERRIMLTNKFVEAKEAKGGRDPGKLVAICEALLQDPSVEEAVRIGDCYALLIEHFVSANDMQEAYHYLQEMQNTRRIQPQQYLDKELIEQVYKAVGAKPTAGGNAGAMRGGEGKGRDEDDSMIDEDLSMNNSNRNTPIKKNNDVSASSSRRPAPKQQQQMRQEDEDEVDEEIAEEVDEEMDSPKQPQRGGGRYGQQQQSGTSAHAMKRK